MSIIFCKGLININKKLITLTAAAVLSVSVLFAATGLCADKVEDNTKKEGAEFTFADNEYTFDMFKENLKDDISKENLAKAKSLFKEATKADQDACKACDELYAMDIFKYSELTDECAVIEEFTFDIFKQDLKNNLSKDILDKVKSLFDKAITLENENKLDEAAKTWGQLYSMDIFNNDVTCGEEAYAKFTFDEFKKQLKNDVSKEDLSKAKALFNKAMDYEKNDKFEEAQKVWDELYQLDIFNCGFLDDYSFEQLKEDFKHEVSKNDLNKAELLFKKAMGLEKKGEFEDANQVWDVLYSMDIFGYEKVVDAHSTDTK